MLYRSQFVGDGRYLAIRGCKKNTSPCDEKSLRLIDVDTGAELMSLDTVRGKRARITDNEQHILVSDKETVRVHAIPDDKELARFQLQESDPLRRTLISKDGRRLFLMTKAGIVRVLDIASGQELARFDHDCDSGDSGISASNTNEGFLVVTCTGDKILTIETTTGMAQTRFEQRGFLSSWESFSPDARFLATTDKAKEGETIVRIFETATGRELTNIVTDSSTNFWSTFNRTAVFSQHGHHFAVAGVPSGIINDNRLYDGKNENQLRGEVHVVDLSGAHRLAWLEIAHSDSVVWSGDGRIIAASDTGHSVRLFDLKTGRGVRLLEHDERAEPVAFVSDDRLLLTRDGDNLRLFDIAEGKTLAQLRKNEPVYPRALSPDGRYLAAFNWNGCVGLLEVAAPNRLAYIQHANAFNDLAFSHDSRFLASSSQDGTVRMMETASMTTVARFEHDKPVESVDFSPEGKWLVTRSDGKTRFLWADPEWPFQQLCARMGRNLCREEWQTLFGEGEEWQPTCPQWRN